MLLPIYPRQACPRRCHDGREWCNAAVSGLW